MTEQTHPPEDLVGGSVPAFPVAITKANEHGTQFVDYEFGLTKRECIAMNVMGHIAASHVQGGATFSQIAAEQAVEYADALLKELAK